MSLQGGPTFRIIIALLCIGRVMKTTESYADIPIQSAPSAWRQSLLNYFHQKAITTTLLANIGFAHIDLAFASSSVAQVEHAARTADEPVLHKTFHHIGLEQSG